MKMCKQLIFLSFMLCLTFACKKKVNVFGRVYNAATLMPVVNMETILYPKYKSENSKNLHELTDGRGNYNFDIAKSRKSAKIRINPAEDNLIYWVNPLQRDILDKGLSQQIDFTYLRKKNFTLHFRSTDSTIAYTLSSSASLVFTSKLAPKYYEGKKRNNFGYKDIMVNVIGVEGWNYFSYEILYGSSANLQTTKTGRDSIFVFDTKEIILKEIVL